jgi:integrase
LAHDALLVPMVLVATLVQVHSAAAGVITQCGTPSGVTYYFEGGVIGADKAGWKKDGVTGSFEPVDVKADKLSPLTQQRYAETIKRMIAPTLGKVELQRLKPADVQQWLVAMRQGKRGKRAPRTIIHAFRILQAAIAAAVKLDLIPRNVADNAEPPSARAAKVTIFKAEEIAGMLSALAGTRVHPIACLALYTGMRRSELLALQWGDLDGGTLNVQRSLEQTRSGIRFKPPKTEAGVRSIALPPRAIELLRAHRKAALELRLQLGQGKLSDTDLIFANVDGSPISPNYFSILWGRELKRAGLPSRTFHSIRHSHASALIDAGLDVVRVGRQLGHSKPTVTLSTYAHEFREADTAAADAIEKSLG